MTDTASQVDQGRQGSDLGFILTSSAVRIIAAALEFYRRELAKNGRPANIEITSLARQFIALGSGQEVIGGHRGSLFAPLASAPDGGDMEGPLLSRPDAAEFLGVSVSTLKRREAAGLVSALRHGRVVRYRTTDLIEHMKAGSTC